MDLLLTTPALNVFEHMALDEVLVGARPQEVSLRFYQWEPGPSVTFGYAQAISQVRRELVGFTGPICRRPTGGGIVKHIEDVTFSLIFPSIERPTVIYQRLHEALCAALVLEGISLQMFTQKLPAVAYAPSQNNRASACFINPVENDLLAENGQKMLGGAIRRFGGTVLYQGSLQIPHARLNPACKQAIITAVRSFLGSDLHIQPTDAAILLQARQLAQTQYQTKPWTEKF